MGVNELNWIEGTLKYWLEGRESNWLWRMKKESELLGSGNILYKGGEVIELYGEYVLV
jgi:hypothetical protein